MGSEIERGRGKGKGKGAEVRIEMGDEKAGAGEGTEKEHRISFAYHTCIHALLCVMTAKLRRLISPHPHPLYREPRF